MSTPSGRATAGRRTVLLTGATGNWGRATLRQLREREDLHVLAFSLDTPADRAVLAEFADAPHIEPVYGDLTDPVSVGAAVHRCDVVLHVGGIVSPLADARPELAHAVNVGSMRNIVAAVRALPDPSQVAVVGIGSVAETGDRNPPHHWGRVGDPVRVSHEEYGQTKVVAERLLVDSGLPRWVWLRQTGIFHAAMVTMRDPIFTHAPLGGVLEWATDVDSARLLVRLCGTDVPEELWCDVYNIGGGDQWRLTNWELMSLTSSTLGVRDIRKLYDRNWFALQGFHGQWYTDSDDLQRLVPFRQESVADALRRITRELPPSMRHGGRVPGWLVKRFVMSKLAHAPRGTQAAVRDVDRQEVAIRYGSIEAYRAIGDWSGFAPPEPSRTPTYLDHGYDESLPRSAWDTDVYRQAAAFRGGRLLSDDVAPGRIAERLRWSCAFGHEFQASPRLVLRAGHWCPECVRDSDGYRRQAERNPFLAQLDG